MIGEGGGGSKGEQSPERVAHFRILGRLGQGGMGVVYRAEDEKLRRTVALKLLPDPLGNEERRQRFLREARSAAAITHPNVAVVYQVDEADGRIYIAMELVEGESLRARLERGPIDLATARELALQIARGLAAAHEKGIVHRDLKPENVMITTEGVVKLLDFGLAKAAGGGTRPSGDVDVGLAKTQTLVTSDENRVMGTPEYMSPEQATGEALDVRSDVFSFGIVLYEMLAGTRPFRAPTTGAVLVAIARDPVRPLREVAPQVDLATAEVVARCLAKAPADRFADARRLVQALSGQPSSSVITLPSASAPSQPEVLSLTPSGATRVRSSTSRAVAGLLLLVALVGAGSWWWRAAHRGGAGSPTSIAVTPSAPPGPRDWVDEPTPHAPADAPAADLETYRQAWEAYRDGDAPLASSLFGALAEKNARFGAASLRAAILGVYAGGSDARRLFRSSFEARETLDEHDRAMLEALMPTYLDSPPSPEETITRLRAAASRLGGAELAATLADILGLVGRFDESLASAESALAASPSFARAYYSAAEGMLYLGRFREEEALLDRCLQRFPTSATCVIERGYLLSHQGRCDELAREVRRTALADNSSTTGARWRLSLSLDSGAGAQSMQELLALARPTFSDSAWPRMDLSIRLPLALRDGDLAGAEPLAHAAEEAVAHVEGRSPHGLFAQLASSAALERGDTRLAVARARAYLSRRSAWSMPNALDDGAMEADPVGPLVGLLRTAGEPDATEQEAMLASYRAEFDALQNTYRPIVWMMGWAAAATTPAQATLALEKFPDYGGSVPPASAMTGPYAYVGRAYQLAGRYEEALPHLQHAARSCDMHRDPILMTRAALWWGQSLEALGRTREACDAYGIVLRRWGHAKPRSVTADEARAHATKLGCAP